MRRRQHINESERLPYSLVGIDGNAISILGYVSRAMKENGYSKEAIETYTGEALSGNYDELLALSVAAIDKINRVNGFDDEDCIDDDKIYVDYSKGIHNSYADLIDEAFNYNETDSISVETEGFLRVRVLTPISGRQKCLYIEESDFDDLRIDGSFFIRYLEKNVDGESLVGYVWNNNLELVINDESEFNKLLSKIKRDLHISRVDLIPYVYNASDMQPIIAASKFSKYRRNR